MSAQTLAFRLALAVGLPLAVVATSSVSGCGKGDERGERPNRAAAPSASDHEATCERGTFCLPQYKGKMEVAAPAPFESCNVISALPEGVPQGWEPSRRAKLRVAFHPEKTGQERTSKPEACCYEWREHCAGRPLFDAGQSVVVAPLDSDQTAPSGWTEWPLSVATMGGKKVPSRAERNAQESPFREGESHFQRACRRASEHWLHNAVFEHASVAAFGRVGLDLLGLGAPSALISAAHEAAIDELKHAQLSFALAGELGAKVTGPAACPAFGGAVNVLGPSDLLRQTFREGCVGEASAALLLERAKNRVTRNRGVSRGVALGCEAPTLRRSAILHETHKISDLAAQVLSELCRDEASHAEFAWRTVLWLTSTFAEAESALREEVAALERAPTVTSCAPEAQTKTRGHRKNKKVPGVVFEVFRKPEKVWRRFGVWSRDDADRSRAEATEIAIRLGRAMLSPMATPSLCR